MATGGVEDKSFTMATGGDEDIKNTTEVTYLNYEIVYVTKWGKDEVEKKDGELRVLGEHGLTFKGYVEKQISSKEVRWISMDNAFNCLVVSYLDSDSHTVRNIFFEMKQNSEGLPEECLSKLRDCMIVKKFEKAWIGNPQGLKDMCSALFNQPMFMGKVKMLVTHAEDGSLDEAVQNEEGYNVEYLMVLDVECLCLYRDELSVPEHQLMFWEDEGVNTIERVKLTQRIDSTENTVHLQTKTMSFSYSADTSIVRQLQNLTPKKRHLMTDPILMFDVLPKLIHPVGRGFQGSHGSRYRNPDAGAEGWSGEVLGAGGRSGGSGAGGWSRGSDAGGWSEGPLIIEKIESQLSDAVATFSGNEDMQNVWVTIEFDIKDIIDSGTVPTTDHRSGGMDGNNEKHLEKALEDVEDQLKENNFPVAISRLNACRDLFGNSEKSAIRKLFDKSDIELLRALYFRSLCQ